MADPSASTASMIASSRGASASSPSASARRASELVARERPSPLASNFWNASTSSVASVAGLGAVEAVSFRVSPRALHLRQRSRLDRLSLPVHLERPQRLDHLGGAPAAPARRTRRPASRRGRRPGGAGASTSSAAGRRSAAPSPPRYRRRRAAATRRGVDEDLVESAATSSGEPFAAASARGPSAQRPRPRRSDAPPRRRRPPTARSITAAVMYSPGTNARGSDSAPWRWKPTVTSTCRFRRTIASATRRAASPRRRGSAARLDDVLERRLRGAAARLRQRHDTCTPSE